MKAVTIPTFGKPEVLKYTDVPLPDIKDTEVLIKVVSIGLNYADLAQREGRYRAPANVPADIPGLEVSGLVVAIGKKVKKIKKGSAVCALLAGGGYAEYVAADYRLCFSKSKKLTFEEAACIPEAFFTIWDNVFRRGKLQTGETILIHGGSGGIGTSAIQIAKTFEAKVVVTAGSDKKCAFCKKIGAIQSINYNKLDFENELKDTGVDVILDMIGGDFIGKNLRILKNEGRLIFINAMSGSLSTFDAWEIMRRRLIISGSTLRSRDLTFKSNLAKDVEKHLLPLIEEKNFKPIISKVFSLKNAIKAHEYMESRQHIGKIVLSI